MQVKNSSDHVSHQLLEEYLGHLHVAKRDRDSLRQTTFATRSDTLQFLCTHRKDKNFPLPQLGEVTGGLLYGDLQLGAGLTIFLASRKERILGLDATSVLAKIADYSLRISGFSSLRFPTPTRAARHMGDLGASISYAFQLEGFSRAQKEQAYIRYLGRQRGRVVSRGIMHLVTTTCTRLLDTPKQRHHAKQPIALVPRLCSISKALENVRRSKHITVESYAVSLDNAGFSCHALCRRSFAKRCSALTTDQLIDMVAQTAYIYILWCSNYGKPLFGAGTEKLLDAMKEHRLNFVAFETLEFGHLPPTLGLDPKEEWHVYIRHTPSALVQRANRMAKHAGQPTQIERFTASIEAESRTIMRAIFQACLRSSGED